MSEDKSNNPVARELLQGFVERVNNLCDDQERLRDDKLVLRSEIKAAGLDPKAVDAIVKRSRESESAKQKRQEQQDVIEMYASALGFSIFE